MIDMLKDRFCKLALPVLMLVGQVIDRWMKWLERDEVNLMSCIDILEGMQPDINPLWGLYQNYQSAELV